MLFIAENINVMSRSLGPAMREKDPKPIQETAETLIRNGADYLDLNVGPARKQGAEMMAWIVKTVQEVAGEVPLSLDTTNMEAMEGGLAAYDLGKSRPLINSISAIPDRMASMLPMVTKYNAQFIALMYAKDGIPRDENERAILAVDLLTAATEQGIPIEDMFFDPVAVPVSSQQGQVISCTAFTGMIGDIAPGCNSTCGLSNVSNGSPEELRPILNQVYVTMLKLQGMTSAILDGFDPVIMDIAHDKRPDIDELVQNLMNGEQYDLGGMSKEEQDIIKTYRVLANEALYSDSWLEV